MSKIISLIVPSTYHGETVPEELFQARIVTARDTMTGFFGGATSEAPGIGQWTSDSGELITERVAQVWAVTDEPNALAQVKVLGRALRGLWGQDAILVLATEAIPVFITE